ncbi:MAG: hypothetical protein LBJ21_09050 [Acidobacteriota bacterium]|jgi:hypothetical protein|nr:hypothetical protein [Acidobacteriota bacterium]
MAIVATSASEARENFSEFLDNAGRKPEFISRRRETFIVIPTEIINQAGFGKIRIRFGYDDTEDGRVYFTKNVIFPDVIGWGNSKAEALNSFVEGLTALCMDFHNNFQLYASAPNRKNQIMPVVGILSIIAGGGNIADIIEAGRV